jgi:hypothetical protein
MDVMVVQSIRCSLYFWKLHFLVSRLKNGIGPFVSLTLRGMILA